MNLKQNLYSFIGLLRYSYSEWQNDKCSQMSAALAYYAIFSLAPLLILLTTLVGFMYGQESAKGSIAQQISQYTGRETAETIQSFIISSHTSPSSTWATILGFATLILAAIGILGQLQISLQQVWNVAKVKRKNFRSTVKHSILNKLFLILMTFGVGILLILTISINFFISSLGKFIGTSVPSYTSAGIFQIINALISIFVITFLFAAIYKFLPKPTVAVHWKDVIIGAIFTSILFTIGKFVISFYITYSSTNSAFAAAGSLLAVLVWMYYSALIFYFGAEFTKIYTYTYGSLRNANVKPLVLQVDHETIKSANFLDQIKVYLKSYRINHQK